MWYAQTDSKLWLSEAGLNINYLFRCIHMCQKLEGFANMLQLTPIQRTWTDRLIIMSCPQVFSKVLKSRIFIDIIMQWNLHNNVIDKYFNISQEERMDKYALLRWMGCGQLWKVCLPIFFPKTNLLRNDIFRDTVCVKGDTHSWGRGPKLNACQYTTGNFKRGVSYLAECMFSLVSVSFGTDCISMET